jgi:predicted lactoylglutathione lyase
METKVFINFAVKDLKKSIEFFTKVGYTFNPKYTDETGTCMIISEYIYAMLLTEPRFKDFTNKEVVDARKTIEVMNAFSCDSREAVDAIFKNGIDAGGTESAPTQDHGFMYAREFEDLDGHIWSYFWMDETAIPQNR